jgi:transcriptional regulator with XRE-family HTH domain
MDDGFGARLRRQRERRHIALESIAADTKVSLSLLEGLERDDVSRWPVGIFRRAFVRAYAHHIGLDPDIVIREFLDRHPDAPDVVPTVEPAIPAHEAARPTPPTRIQYLLGSLTAPLFRRHAPAQQLDAPPLESVRTEDVERRPVVHSDAPAWSLSAAADLCTKLGQVRRPDDVAPLLEEAARILDAVGLVAWSWDLAAGGLNPTLAYGYSDAVLAQMTNVRAEADHAVAAAFRSRTLQMVGGGSLATGAIVLPLLTATGCVGVLALELRNGGEQREQVRAFAAILASLLAVLIGAGRWLTRTASHTRPVNGAATQAARSAVAI